MSAATAAADPAWYWITRPPSLDGLAFGHARRTHRAAHAVGDDLGGAPVPVGPGLAEVGDGDDGETGKAPPQIVGVEAKAAHGAGTEGLDEDVGVVEQPVEEAASGARGEVEGHAALVDVEGKEEAALLGVGDVAGEGAETAGGVAGAGALDLHHVGAVGGEQPGADRPGHELREINHPHSLERAAHAAILECRMGLAVLRRHMIMVWGRVVERGARLAGVIWSRDYSTGGVPKRPKGRKPVMHLDKWFGDSYDIVKQSILRWLSSCGEWQVHPMFTPPVDPRRAEDFERFLGVPLVSTKTLNEHSGRDAFLAPARSCAGHLFLDPRHRTPDTSKPRDSKASAGCGIG